MADLQLKRQNHYVPIWYQKGFLSESSNSLHYLNFQIPQTKLSDGRVFSGRAVRWLPPASCFKAQDLYTTTFGGSLNDQIERYFFGAIDNDGAIAVRAFSENDQHAIHTSFLKFFEYLDIQKLRTPKGLDWIRSKFPGVTQLELMLEMQALRQMHCTMWSECVREIVSAEDSDVNFIVTDHPVTVFNVAFPPSSHECQYPDDPSIELNGTQTVFALDAKHCLILTNLEYAKDRADVDLKAHRTNARFRGQSLVRTDAFVRTRKLTSSQVISINFLLKAKARQYIAASNSDWLYPETQPSANWGEVAHVLKPRKEELWQFGGETYIGYKDGTTHYQDQYGRSSPHQHLQKSRPLPSPGPNDACGCGSGHKFKKCCEGVPSETRPSWSVYSIRERNLILYRAVKDILGLNRGKTWDDVRKDLSEFQVKRIHEVFSSLWPKDTDIAELLPRRDDGIFRAIYLGTLDPRTVTGNVTSWLAYFDEIVVPHPFINEAFLKPEFSPTSSPNKHKRQALKNIFVLLMLEPFIDLGVVHLIPDPSDFNDQFRRDMWEMAKHRTANWDKSKDGEKEKIWERLVHDDMEREIRSLPVKSLRAQIQRSTPEVDLEMLERVVEHFKRQHATDPLALLQPLVPGKEGAQYLMMKGFNLEVGLFYAELTGAVIYTDIRTHWRHLHEHCDASCSRDSPLSVSSKKLEKLNFLLEPDLHGSLLIRQTGRLGEARGLFRRIGNAARSTNGLSQDFLHAIETQIEKIGDEIRRMWEKPKSADGHRLRGMIEISIPQNGFVRNGVRRLALTYGRARHVQPAPLAIFIDVDQQ